MNTQTMKAVELLIQQPLAEIIVPQQWGKRCLDTLQSPFIIER